MDYKEKLEEFHKTMFLKTGDYRADTNQNYVPANPTVQLRANLIEEECQELLYELRNSGSIYKVRKELCDLLYVLFGTVAVLGLPVEDDFEVVHQNNMGKFIKGSLREDGKWVKPKDYPTVQFEFIDHTAGSKKGVLSSSNKGMPSPSRPYSEWSC